MRSDSSNRLLRTLVTASVVVAMAAGTLGGCLDDLPSPTQIIGLRVMAITASAPEVAPGTTVLFTPLVVDTEERALTFRWSACVGTELPAGSTVDPATIEDDRDCNQRLDAGDTTVIDMGTGATAELTVPASFFDDPNVIGEAYGLGDSVPPELLPVIATLVGVNMRITMEVTAGDVILVTTKRIKVSLSPKPNTNPEPIAYFLRKKDEAAPIEPPTTWGPPADGKCFIGEEAAALQVGEGEWEILPLNVPTERESFQLIGISPDPDQPFQLLDDSETYFLSIFSRGGAFSDRNVKATPEAFDPTIFEWKFEDAPETETIPVWIVTRDGRGGTAWCHSMLERAEAP